MKILKRLFVGSIVLVLLATPLIATAQIQPSAKARPLSIPDDNSLGKFEIVHVPLLWRFIDNHGMDVKEYWPPADYIYEFPEDENGKVWMNFTLTIKHWLNDVGTYWARFIFPNNFRWTWINNMYVFDPTRTDYISFENKTICTFQPSEYTVTAYATIGLETNGQNKTVRFSPYFCPAITPIPILQEIGSKISGLKNGLSETIGANYVELTIVPT